MRVLIIEDEPKAVLKLERTINRTSFNISVVKVVSSVIEGVSYLKDHSVDLILSDIHLSDGLSFEIFETLKTDTPIIFTTAYDNYAIDAFKANSIDYLLKPIKQSALESAFSKYQKRIGQNKEHIINYERLINAVQPNATYKRRFLVESPNGELKSIFTQEIAYFFADGKYTFLRSADAKKYYCKSTISNLVEQLDPENFFQINRKYIAHIGSIQQVLKYSKSRLKIALTPSTDDDVLVSNERAKLFKKWLDGNS